MHTLANYKRINVIESIPSYQRVELYLYMCFTLIY
jgi:hypothetical protein